MDRIKIIGLILVFFYTQSVKGQGELLVKNFAHCYDPRAEIDLKHSIITLDERNLIFLKMTIRHNRTRIKDLATTFAFMDRYSGSLNFSTDTIRLANYWINNVRNQHLFQLEIHNPNQKKILIFRIHNLATDNEYYYDIVVDPKAEILNSGIMIQPPGQNLPYFRKYLRSSEEFKIRNYKTVDSIHYVYRYSNDFPVASPPFSTDQDEVRRELKIDSTFALKSNTITRFHGAGMYFFQHDTTAVNGLAIRNESPSFPRGADYDELIEALVYFSTNSEMEALLGTTDKKTAFDEYWLDVAGSPDKAKKVIKEYYKRIRQANELFTSYKQGWKTDKGMIYVIFGPPDVVHKDGKKEEWIYERSSQLPRLSFEFQKIESIFTNDHYILIRKRSYQQIWYKAIDLWRKGQKEI